MRRISDPVDGRVEARRPTDTELLHGLGQAVIATDPDGTIFFWNAAAEELYGWHAEEVLGRDVADVLVPRQSRQGAAEVMEAVRQGRTWSGGFPLLRRGGEVLHALITDIGVYRDGALIGVVGESLNLGDAVRHLMERSSDAAILLDEDNLVSYASPAVAPLFGWVVHEVEGTYLSDRIHPDDLETFADLLDDVADQRERVGELRVQSAGDWIWVEMAVTELYADAAIGGLVCNIRRSERLARVEERERLLNTMHSEVLQDLFATTLELDRLLSRAGPHLQPRIEAARESVGRAIGTLREVVRPPQFPAGS